MKVLYFNHTKNNGAELKVKLEDSDDCWCIYNILSIGDTLTCFTTRKVDLIGINGKCTDKIIKKFNITIIIEKFEFNTYDESICISGRNTTELDFMRIGQYHTVELTDNSIMTLKKTIWSKTTDDLFKRAKDRSDETIRAVLLIGEGIAIFYKLTKFITKEVFKIKKSIPKRYNDIANIRHDKSIESFFSTVIKSLNQHVNINKQYNVTIAGPGFFKDNFTNYIKDNAIKLGFTDLYKMLPSFTIQSVSMVARSALNEIPDLSLDITAFDELKKRMGLGTNTFLIDSGAIEHLLITDGVLRCQSVESRKDRLSIIDKVKSHGGKVTIVSDNHHSSDVRLSGIAALTRYSIS